jgi:hypothetical protein
VGVDIGQEDLLDVGFQERAGAVSGDQDAIVDHLLDLGRRRASEPASSDAGVRPSRRHPIWCNRAGESRWALRRQLADPTALGRYWL